jgi:hypothetical protein
MKWLKRISTQATRVKVYECEIGSMGSKLITHVGKDIQVKLFGMWWVTIIKYSYFTKI